MSRLDEAQDYADKGPSVSRATVGKLAEIARRLAAADPIQYQGDIRGPTCTLCLCDEILDGVEMHNDDCPWLMARRLAD